MRKDILELINENKNLIYKIASRYKNYYDIEDLYQAGVIGLINAYSNFKDDKNTKFSTYAYIYIKGEILEYIRNDRAIRISSDYLKIYKSYEKAREFLSQEYGRMPSIDEISMFLELPVETLSEVISSSEFVMSLDSELNEDSKETFYNNIVVDTTSKIDNKILLEGELEKLDELEQKIIDLRYYRDYTQSEVANVLGISQVQVSRYENKALKLIHGNIAA